MTYFYGKDARGEWRWHLKALNNRIIATSGEGYDNEKDCLHAIDLVKSSEKAPVRKVERI